MGDNTPDKKQEDPNVQGEETVDATPSWMERLGMRITAAQEDLKKNEQKYADAQKKANAQREAVNEALANGTSVTSAILQEHKPKFDENKEKRLQQRAVAQSLGDMLSAVEMGAHAYGKKGAGYVPTLPEGSHLKSLEEINRMREEYRKADEAWKDLELQARMKQVDKDIESAKQMLKAYEKDEVDAAKAVTDAAKAVATAEKDFIDAGIKAEEKESERQGKIEDREDRQAHTAAIKALSKGEKNDLTEEGYIHTLLSANDTYDEMRETGEMVKNFDTGEWEERVTPRKTTKPKTYTLNEHNALGKYDARVKKVKKYMKEGMSLENAVAKVLQETQK